MRETPFKRVITATNPAGRSIAREIGPAPIHELDPIRERLEDTSWGADIGLVTHDPQKVFKEYHPEEWQVEPPAGGAVFRVINIPANSGFDLHRTDTIDFGIVLSGEVWLLLEEGEVQLTVNDCVMLNGDIHGWENRSARPCRLAAVLMSTRAP